MTVINTENELIDLFIEKVASIILDTVIEELENVAINNCTNMA
ncbi:MULTISPECIES: hypothetical protein [unclassified Bacillus cereus group]|nr:MULTISPECIES: hypothetical protein [unclassified Bacillus cereus group]MDA2662451.1 hypothetical protein [Bacillus cereus group sp. Bc032]MDA2673170.1 hypothetical protein [Bacillus cereus group sp. Bc031]MDA2678598.1 hypothetical protein [Bacillus cereus group sp. Bc029]MDA2684107.1 hypothetical protein [Bacillus cereus group sp. Bc030]MDA2739587.1 hypothetical protein [Bacillus cereus group sp. Bc011]